MATYNTSNLLGSADPRDLYDNSQIADEYVNSTDRSTDDRFGRTRYTWAGMESEFKAAQSDRDANFDTAQDDRRTRFDDLLASSGYNFVGDYAAGIEITEYNQLVRDGDGEFWRLSGAIDLPYTTTGDGLPESGAFIPAGDATLRQELSNGTATVSSDTGLESISEALNRRALVYSANAFGFDVNGTADNNRDAIIDAVEAANGMPVKVYANENYELSPLGINNTPIDLEIIGGGRADRTQATSRLATITYDLINIQGVSQIVKESYAPNGDSSEVWALYVGDSSAYSRGDIVRVVSDDRDPSAAGGGSTDRKFGEVGYVIGVDAGKIYISNVLEDALRMSTNIRVGMYQNIKCRVIGLESEGGLEGDSGQMFVLNGALRADIDTAFWGHPWIGFQPNGCALCKFKVKGQGKGDSSGSLGYLINDAGGHKNVYLFPEGSNYRHLFTTNFNTTSENDPNIYNYGGSRDIKVLMGRGLGCQGAPWDTHAGSRRTVFYGCYTGGMLANSTTSTEEYQIREAGTEILDPSSDGTSEYLIRLHNSRIDGSTVYVRGGILTTRTLRSTMAFDGGVKQFIIFDNCQFDYENSLSLINARGNVEITLSGGRYTNKNLYSNSRGLFTLENGAALFLQDPELNFGPITDSEVSFLRPFVLTGSAAHLRGRCRFNFVGAHTQAQYSSMIRSETSGANVFLKILADGSFLPNPITGGNYESLFYVVSSDGGESRTNISDFNEYIQTLGAL